MKDFEAVAEQFYRESMNYACTRQLECTILLHVPDCKKENIYRMMASFAQLAVEATGPMDEVLEGRIAARMAARIRETHATER